MVEFRSSNMCSRDTFCSWKTTTSRGDSLMARYLEFENSETEGREMISREERPCGVTGRSRVRSLQAVWRKKTNLLLG